MASSDRTPDMSRVIADLSRAIHSLNDNIAGLNGGTAGRPGSRTPRTPSGAGGRQKASTNPTDKSFKTLNATLSETDKALAKLRRGAADANQSFDNLYTIQNAYIKGIATNERISEKSQERLAERINRSISQHSFLGQSMENAGRKINFFEEKLEETAKFLSQYGDILKETNAQSLSSITDHEKLKKALNKLNREYELSDDIQQMIHRNEFARAAQALDNEAKNANVIRNSIRRTSNSFSKLDNVTQSLRTGISKATDAIGAGFIKEAAGWGGAVALVTAGAKEAYTQFWQTASSGFGGAFVQMSKSAIGLGISLQALTAINKEHMTLIAKMGFREFNASLKQTQQQLMQLGLTTDEAARVGAIMSENARLTGVDVKNKQAMAAAANEQISSFETLRAVTGESIEVLAQQSKAMMQSNDTMKIMGSMTKQQRTLVLKGINLERTRLTTMGLTNEAALGVIKTLQGISNEKASTRIEAGAKLRAAGAMLNVDPAVTDRMAKIMQKSKSSWSDEDKAFMADGAKTLVAATDKMQGAGADLSKQILGDTAEEMLTIVKPLAEDMRGANLDRAITPKEVEANKALGRVPAGIAESSAKIESVLRLLESPLTKIAVGVAGIIYLLARHLVKKKEGADDVSGSPLDTITDAIGGKKDEKKENKLTLPGGDPCEDPCAGKRMAKPGDSVADPSRFDSQMTEVAKKHGWKESTQPPQDGLQGLNQRANQRAAQRQHGRRQSTRAGRNEMNNTTIGSEALQERLRINRQRVADRFNGPPQPPPRRTRRQRIRDAISTRRTQVTDTVRRARGSKVGQAAENAAKSLKSGIGSIGRLGAKAIPFIGFAVAGIEALKGGFDAVERAGEIFGVDTSKQALTTAQKVSAGLAGALNTITFGLIPTDETARLMNDVATDGVEVIGDYIEDAAEFLMNKAVPALYDAFKSVLGYIGNAVMGIFTGDNGAPGGGLVSTILGALWKAVKFMGTAITKGAIKIGADVLEMIVDKIPSFMGGDTARAKLAQAKAYASKDTKFSDFDSPEDSEKRKVREEKKRKRAERDEKPSNEKVQGQPEQQPQLPVLPQPKTEASQSVQAKATVQMPPEISAILAKTHGNRTDEDNKVLAEYSKKIDAAHDQIKRTSASIEPLADEMRGANIDRVVPKIEKPDASKSIVAVAPGYFGEDLSKKTINSAYDTVQGITKPEEKKTAIAGMAQSEPKKEEKPVVPGIPPEQRPDSAAMVTQFGQALTDDQLAAQGIRATPAIQAAHAISPSTQQAKEAADKNGGVNNTTVKTPETTPPKTESETLLSGILEKMTTLVELTDKGVKIAELDSKTTLARLNGQRSDPSGYSPTMASFMNMA